LSGVPFVKDFKFVYGEAAALSPLIRRVIANNPSPFTYTGSGTYLVGREGGPLAVVDPGPDDLAHREALVAAIGRGRATHIFVTHTHSDHCGGARALAKKIGAPVYGFGPHPVADQALGAPALDEGADFSFAPDHPVTDGEVFHGDGWTLEAVATPGHLSNHLCYALKEERALFTGDHVMGWSTTVVAPPEGHMGQYLDSLEKLLVRDDRIYFPTHGAPIAEPQRFVRAIRAHRRLRDGQILDQLAKGPRAVADLVPVMYADIDKRLHGAAALNVFAHLIRLCEIGAAATVGAPAMRGIYRLRADGVD
jgi:glyoxylase-like metal-dependent hydrolase (beta-lactamase superfamily II)